MKVGELIDRLEPFRGRNEDVELMVVVRGNVLTAPPRFVAWDDQVKKVVVEGERT